MIRLLCVCKDDGKPGCILECDTCNGDGTEIDHAWADCPDCGGAGERVCGDCDGRGWVECDERFYEPGLFVSTIASVEAA